MMTAVEWYSSKITKLEFWVETKQISWKEYHIGKDKLIEQAKAIEKEQKKGDYEIGYLNGALGKAIDGEKYYKETYEQ
jgi:hypothetical protein